MQATQEEIPFSMSRPHQKEMRSLLQHKEMPLNASMAKSYGTASNPSHRRKRSKSKKIVPDSPSLAPPQSVADQTFPVQMPNGLPPVPPPPAAAPRRRASSSDRVSLCEVNGSKNYQGRRGSGGEKRRTFSGDYELGGGTLSPPSGLVPPLPIRSRSPLALPNHGYSNSFSAGPPVPHAFPPIQSSPRLGNPNRHHPLKRGSTGGSSHRRTYSDFGNEHPLIRGNSSGSLKSLSGTPLDSESLKLLPDPRWGGGSGANRARTISGGSQGHVRNGSFSGDPLVINGEGGRFSYGTVGSPLGVEVIGVGASGGGMHRRTPSDMSMNSLANSLSSAVSVDQSVEPVMTDLTKSAMFKGVTNDGILRLQLPKDNFRLLSDRDLESGCVYKRQLVEDENDYFQDYHITDENTKLVYSPSECTCNCDNCNHCHSRRKQLPPPYYIMAVEPDLYRRLFDEILESKSMPCGLFFCGHHDDVRYPSIMIAVVIVSIAFILMAVATVYVKG